MTPEPRTVSSVRDSTTIRERVTNWVLITGDRRVVAGGLVVGITGVVWALIAVGLLAVGPDSSVASLFGSGLTAGVITLLTIALSINQLVLSRVFGSVNGLVDRLNGSRELRRTVESIAGVPSSPIDPATFLSLIATTLNDRAEGLLATVDDTDWDPPETLTSAVADLAAYGENLETNLESSVGMKIILGTEYAQNMAAISHIRNEYAASIPEEISEELQAIEELLESVAIMRQFYKTISIQRDLATLSRLLVYSGVTAFLAAIIVTLVYRTGSTTLPVAMLPVVVSVGLGIIVAPLALFVTYILREATVARYTVSVGPFIPSRDQD